MSFDEIQFRRKLKSQYEESRRIEPDANYVALFTPGKLKRGTSFHTGFGLSGRIGPVLRGNGQVVTCIYFDRGEVERFLALY